jgi:hypothetical protein
MSKNQRVWIPLRKLTAKAKKHREAELKRLRNDPRAAERLEMEDQMIPMPASPGLFPPGSDVVELSREQWRQLLGGATGHGSRIPAQFATGAASPSSAYTPELSTSTVPAYDAGGLGSHLNFEPAYIEATGFHTAQNLSSNPSPEVQLGMTANDPGDFALGQTVGSSYSTLPVDGTGWNMSSGMDHWLWADADPSVDVFANVDMDAADINMDMDGEMDWYNWVESAKGMELGAGPSGTGPL